MLTEIQELFIETLQLKGNIKDTALAMDIPLRTAYSYHAKLKDEILQRARDTLSIATLRATSTVVELLDADGSTDKGELRLKTAESIMDRSGLTKHTNVDVQIESDNGIFVLPSRIPVSEDTGDT